jgi:hypothetical protein
MPEGGEVQPALSGGLCTPMLHIRLMNWPSPILGSAVLHW